MEYLKQVHDFATKWVDKFRDQKINYIELVDHYMADDCEALGFQMDCGHAFSDRRQKQRKHGTHPEYRHRLFCHSQVQSRRRY